MSKNISIEDFVKVIIKSIDDEPYLDKQNLFPKIKALAYVFRLNINASVYKDISSPSSYQKALRESERQMFEKKFWERKFKEKTGDDLFKEHCQELNKKLIESGF